jgi:hypothetical protein
MFILKNYKSLLRCCKFNKRFSKIITYMDTESTNEPITKKALKKLEKEKEKEA